MTSSMVRVEVHEDTETLATTVSRDIDDGFYELPETLVVEFEEARDRFDAAADAISKYIAINGLEPRHKEDQ
jgi:hypothetical protein